MWSCPALPASNPRLPVFLFIGLLAFLPMVLRAQDGAIDLKVDARDVLSRHQHAHLSIPVHPGHLALAYPKWVPGEHRPNGPVTQLMDLRIHAGG
ncbi:MAG TPA: hypothetical protein VIM98_12525, partial [Dyella sp.]